MKAEKRPRNGAWSDAEHGIFLDKYAQFGSNWRKIASFLPPRTPIQVRTHAQKFEIKQANRKRRRHLSSLSRTHSSSSCGVDELEVPGVSTQTEPIFTDAVSVSVSTTMTKGDPSNYTHSPAYERVLIVPSYVEHDDDSQALLLVEPEAPFKEYTLTVSRRPTIQQPISINPAPPETNSPPSPIESGVYEGSWDSLHGASTGPPPQPFTQWYDISNSHLYPYRRDMAMQYSMKGGYLYDDRALPSATSCGSTAAFREISPHHFMGVRAQMPHYNYLPYNNTQFHSHGEGAASYDYSPFEHQQRNATQDLARFLEDFPWLPTDKRW